MHSNYNFSPLLHFKPGNWCAFTLSLQQVHFLFLFSSAKTTFSAFCLFFLISSFLFVCVSALQILAMFSSLDNKCVVNVLFLTLLLLCFFGISINSPKVTFLASSLSANISYIVYETLFFSMYTYSHNINNPYNILRNIKHFICTKRHNTQNNISIHTGFFFITT